MDNLAIYVHYPFCVLKCPYCDFNSHVREKVKQEEYILAYQREISYFAKRLGKRKVSTIFFGGGTPSLMEEGLVQEILNSLEQNFTIDDNVEISLEANPSSVENSKLANFKKHGVNRLSLGIQSLNADDLKFLGRAHNRDEALEAINIAQQLFPNFSLDFIYALPQQNLNNWLRQLEDIFAFSAKHLSLYQLTIEKGTKFYAQHRAKEFVIPNNDLAAEFYQETTKLCEDKLYHRYEVSNYAKRGYECKHNKNYWGYGEYLGIGAGAHSRVRFAKEDKLYALVNEHLPEKWLSLIRQNSNALQKREALDEIDINSEKLLLGLRQRQGVSLKEVKVNLPKLEILKNESLLTENNKQISLTDSGYLLLNSIVTILDPAE